MPLSGTGVQPCFNNFDCSSGSYCKKTEGGCNSAGVCTVRPEICLLFFGPVCGCNGVTYPNDCEAARAGLSVAYQGECVVPLPDISVSPTSYNFGNVQVGSSSAAQTFTVSNTGTANLVIGTIILTGTNANQFSKLNDNCSGQTLAPSGSCTVQVKFSPTSLGSKSATLSIPSNDPDENPLNVSLSGTAIAPAVTCSFTAYATQLSRGSNLKFFAAVQNNTDEVQVFQFATKVNSTKW